MKQLKETLGAYWYLIKNELKDLFGGRGPFMNLEDEEVGTFLVLIVITIILIFLIGLFFDANTVDVSPYERIEQMYF